MVKNKGKDPAKDKSASSGAGFKHRNKLIAIAVIAALVVGIAYYLQKTSSTVDTQLPMVDGIPCETQEYLNFHVHAHLDVFVDGHAMTVPALIGIPGTCLYWLHTHNTDGIMHMEAPHAQDFALAQFIDIWKSSAVLTANSNNPISAPPSGDPIIYVNGQVVSTSLADTKLNAHDEIVLVYGNPPPNIPTFYQFPEGL